MNTAPDLLDDIAQAYFQGRDRPPLVTYTSSGREYGDMMQALLNKQLTPDELEIVSLCMSLQQEGLQAARQGRLESARGAFDQVLERLRAPSLSPAGKAIIQALSEPAEAYLYYRMEDYARAHQLIRHASGLDHALVNDFGFEIFSAHRLQLGLNLMRIHARTGELGAAVEMGAAFLDYLELRVELLPATLACARKNLDSVPDTIIDWYFDKFAGEIALVLAGRMDADTAERFERVGTHAIRNGCEDSGLGAHAHAWLHGKKLALAGDTELYWENAIALLKMGRQQEASLWFGTIMDVIVRCPSLGPEGLKLADRLTAETAELADTPWLWKIPEGQTEPLWRMRKKRDS